jgi:C-terminal processing protease CtpA/Prc
LAPRNRRGPHDLDSVGLTLVFKGGDYFVGGVATQNGKPTAQGIQAGDKLIQIGTLRTSGESREAIFAAMHGKPGDRRSLVIERDGKQFQVEASVIAF